MKGAFECYSLESWALAKKGGTAEVISSLYVYKAFFIIKIYNRLRKYFIFS